MLCVKIDKYKDSSVINKPTEKEKDQGYRIFECGKDGEVNELNKSIEVVLPSGRFATINSIKWRI